MIPNSGVAKSYLCRIYFYRIFCDAKSVYYRIVLEPECGKGGQAFFVRQDWYIYKVVLKFSLRKYNR